jgi:hypothetical protein
MNKGLTRKNKMNRDSFLKVKYSVRSFDISKCVAREE